MKNIIFDNCDWNYPTCGGYRVYECRKYWHIESLSNYQGSREFRYSLLKSKYTREQVTDKEWIERNEEYLSTATTTEERMQE